MTLHEITVMAQDGLIGLVIILLGLIRIPKIDINFWGLLGRAFGRAINGDLLHKINNIESELKIYIQLAEEERIREARRRIIRFADEVYYEQGHSKEHYDEILEDINVYEKYCKAHAGFVNNKATVAIDSIKAANQYCIDNHDYLEYKGHDKTK